MAGDEHTCLSGVKLLQVTRKDCLESGASVTYQALGVHIGCAALSASPSSPWKVKGCELPSNVADGRDSCSERWN